MKFTNLVGFVSGLMLGIALCVVLWAAAVTSGPDLTAQYKAKAESLEFQLKDLEQKYVELNAMNTQNYTIAEECIAHLR